MPKFAVTLNLPNRPDEEEEIGVSVIGAMKNGETREVELSVAEATYLDAGFGLSVVKAKTTIEEAKAEVDNAQTEAELYDLEAWEKETDKRTSIYNAIKERRKQLETERQALEQAAENPPTAEEKSLQMAPPPPAGEGGE